MNHCCGMAARNRRTDAEIYALPTAETWPRLRGWTGLYRAVARFGSAFFGGGLGCRKLDRAVSAAFPGSRDTDWSLSMLHLNNAQQAKLRWIFLGPHGIRAGWSVVIFLMLLAPVDL